MAEEMKEGEQMTFPARFQHAGGCRCPLKKKTPAELKPAASNPVSQWRWRLHFVFLEVIKGRPRSLISPTNLLTLLERTCLCSSATCWILPSSSARRSCNQLHLLPSAARSSSHRLSLLLGEEAHRVNSLDQYVQNNLNCPFVGPDQVIAAQSDNPRCTRSNTVPILYFTTDMIPTDSSIQHHPAIYYTYF